MSFCSYEVRFSVWRSELVEKSQTTQNISSANIFMQETLKLRSSFNVGLTLTGFIIKFPYNARSDWLKQRALSEIQTLNPALVCVISNVIYLIFL